MKITPSAVAFFLAAQALMAQLPPGTLDLSFDAGSGITEPVYASAVLDDGKVLIAGNFHAVNGTATPGIARLLPNGTTDLAFTTNTLQWGKLATNVLEWGLWPYCSALAVQLDGKILVAGDFWNPDTWWESGLIRLNPDGSWDDTFPLPISTTVYALVLQTDGRVIAGGGFDVAGRGCVVRLNPDGTVDETFLYGLAGANNIVRTVALQTDGKILIGGDFTAVNGVARNGIARLNADGSLDTSFNANVSQVNSLVIQTNGKVVIGGSFTIVNGAGFNRLARLNADGSLDNSFLSGLSGADNQVYSLTLQTDGKVLVGGAFSSINGTSRPGLARLSTSGVVDATFSPGTGGLDGAVYSVTQQPNGQLLVGGAFASVGGVLRSRIARLGTSGSLDTSFDNGPAVFTGRVTALAAQPDGKILANSVARTGIGRFQPNGAPDTSFLTSLAGANGAVNAIAVTAAGKILAAGQFSQFNSFPARGLVRIDSGGSVDATFQNGIGGTNGYLNCLYLQPDGRILIGGSFTEIKGVGRTNLARLNADGSLDFTFLSSQAGVKGEVFSLGVQPDGKVLVGGNYTEVNGVSRKCIARLNADGSLDRTYQEGMTGVSGPVYAIAVQPDTNAIIAGLFRSVNSSNAYHIARLTRDGSWDTNFAMAAILTNNSAVIGIRSLALQTDGRMLLGGDFWLAASGIFNNIARFRTNGTPEGLLERPQGADAEVTALLLLNSTNVVIGGAFGTFNGAPRSYLARMAYDAPTVPLEIAVNNSDLRWTNDAVAPWRGMTFVAHDGSAAGQSASLANSQRSTLRSAITGPGCLSFWWKVSSELGYDYLTFTCIGAGVTNQFRISGEVDWQQKTVCIPAGVHTLEWTYSKDGSVSEGLDAAWVDEVTFAPGNLPPVITLDPTGVTNFAGATVVFNAAGAGIPPLTYQWLFNGSEIPDATNLTCVLRSVVPEQAGSYSLRVSNPYGNAVSAGASLVLIPVRAVGLGTADYNVSNAVALATIDAVAVSAGQFHNLILHRDGTVYAWGNNGSGQCAVPPDLGPAIAIAAGGYHSLAVKADGTVVGWGGNTSGQASAPAGLSNVIAVAAGMWHSLALRANGTVVSWGDNSDGQSVPQPSLTNIIAVAAGGSHSLALRADGIVFGWGGNFGPSGFVAGQASVPWGLNQVVAIGAGSYHSVAVKSDGSIVGWGDNTWGQLTVPTNLPMATAIAGGGAHTVAVFADGTAAAWGEDGDGRCDVPRTLTNVVAVAAGQAHTLLLFGQRPPAPEIQSPARSGKEFSVQVPTVVGKLYALEYVPSFSVTNWTSLPAVRGTGDVVPLTDPSASAAQRFYRVRQW